MNEKITSAITKVSLNQATFHHKSFTPSYINFLFGKNGCGKSTVAKILKDKTDIIWDSGHSSDDYLMLVYNEDFINKNIASYSDMPGVFTISEQNAQIQKDIEDATAELGIAQTELKNASENLSTQEALLKKQQDTFQTICWEKTKDFRKSVDAALAGKKTKDGLAKALLTEVNSTQYDADSLVTMCEAAFSNDATTYPELYKADISSIPTSSILSKPIMSTSSSEFATFMKAINATNWVRQGHEQFHSEDKCPYCQQKLPSNFEDEIIRCFDKEYEADLTILRSFKSNYGAAINDIWKSFSNNLSNAYPKIKNELDSYAKLLDTFKAKAEINAQRFNEKIAHPNTIVELEDLSSLIIELNNAIDSMNLKIKENNDIVNDRTKKQPQCKAAVICYLAFILSDEIGKFRDSRSKLQKEIDTLTKTKAEAHNRVTELRKTISSLRKNVVNTSAAVEGINTILADTGFQGFHLREKDNTPNVYEVIRTNTGLVAENLSEGERNFIAFLYFH